MNCDQCGKEMMANTASSHDGTYYCSNKCLEDYLTERNEKLTGGLKGTNQMFEYLMHAECWVLAKTAMDAETLVRRNLGDRTVDSVAVVKSKPTTSIPISSKYLPDDELCVTCHYRKPIKDASQCEHCRDECRKQGAVYPADHEGQGARLPPCVCGKPQMKPGALLWSPPDKDGLCGKTHLCADECWPKVRSYGESLCTGESSGPTKDFVDAREVEILKNKCKEWERQHDELAGEFKSMEMERDKYRSELVYAAHYLSIGQKETVEKTGVADAIHTRLIKPSMLKKCRTCKEEIPFMKRCKIYKDGTFECLSCADKCEPERQPLSDAQLQVAIDELEKQGYTVLLPFDEEDARLAGCKPSKYMPPLTSVNMLRGIPCRKCRNCYIEDGWCSHHEMKIRMPGGACDAFSPNREVLLNWLGEGVVSISPQKPEHKLIQKALNLNKALRSYMGDMPPEDSTLFKMLRLLMEAAQEYEAERKKQEEVSCETCAKSKNKPDDELAPCGLPCTEFDLWENKLCGACGNHYYKEDDKRPSCSVSPGHAVPPDTPACDDFEPKDDSTMQVVKKEAMRDYVNPNADKPIYWRGSAIDFVTDMKGIVPHYKMWKIEDALAEAAPRPKQVKVVDDTLPNPVGEQIENMDRALACSSGQHEPDLEFEQHLHQNAIHDTHECVTYYCDGGSAESKVIMKQHVCKYCRVFYGDPADELLNRKEPEKDEDRREEGPESS